MTIDSSSERKHKFGWGLTPVPAWTAILGLVVFTTLCIVAGAGAILRPLFPVGAFGVGVCLYRRYSVLYLGFTWWLWILTPLAARFVDYRSGWDSQRLMLVAPYLVSLITLQAVVKYLPAICRQHGLPFMLSIVGVLYGCAIGLVQFAPVSVFRSALDWLTPISLGFYLFVNWRNYPNYSQNLQHVFAWGVLVTGVYGIYQYLVAPEWDKYWLNQSGMFTSAGNPEPLGIRVWSTMHSPGPFSSFMLAGLLLLFSDRSWLRIPAMAAGYLAFLLSLVRSAWGSWLLGLLHISFSLKPKLQLRLILTIAIMAMCVIPLATVEPFAGAISKRLLSLADLQNDNSFNDRSGNYQQNLDLALQSWMGNGIGGTWATGADGSIKSTVVDSGIIETLLTIGWLGAIPYFLGLGLMMSKVLQSSVGRTDAFMNAARGISLSFFAQLIFGNSISGFSGILLWSFLGVSLAADRYHRYVSQPVRLAGD
jgi:hypothetical protein